MRQAFIVHQAIVFYRVRLLSIIKSASSSSDTAWNHGITFRWHFRAWKVLRLGDKLSEYTTLYFDSPEYIF